MDSDEWSSSYLCPTIEADYSYPDWECLVDLFLQSVVEKLLAWPLVWTHNLISYFQKDAFDLSVTATPWQRIHKFRNSNGPLMGQRSNFFDLGQVGIIFLMLVSGQPPLNLENFPPKSQLFPLRFIKISLGLGQKIPWSKAGLPLFSLRVKSLLRFVGSGPYSTMVLTL